MHLPKTHDSQEAAGARAAACLNTAWSATSRLHRLLSPDYFNTCSIPALPAPNAISAGTCTGEARSCSARIPSPDQSAELAEQFLKTSKRPDPAARHAAALPKWITTGLAPRSDPHPAGSCTKQLAEQPSWLAEQLAGEPEKNERFALGRTPLREGKRSLETTIACRSFENGAWRAASPRRALRRRVTEAGRRSPCSQTVRGPVPLWQKCQRSSR